MSLIESPKFIQLFKETIGDHFIFSFGLIYGLIAALLYVIITKTKFNPLPIALAMLILAGLFFIHAHIKAKGKVFDQEDIELITKTFNPFTNFWHFVKHILWFSLFFALGFALSKGFSIWVTIPIIALALFVLYKKTDLLYHGVKEESEIPNDLTDSFGTHEGLIYHLSMFGIFLMLGYMLGAKV